MRKFFQKFSQQLGFSLIELMVVVAIIGVLATAGLVAFRNAQASGNDARRVADVDAIAKAMEQYYIANAAYPLAEATIGTTTYFANGNTPKDPTTGASYFTAAPTATTYCLCARLKVLGKGNHTAAACPASFTAPAAGVQGFYCITNQQN